MMLDMVILNDMRFNTDEYEWVVEAQSNGRAGEWICEGYTADHPVLAQEKRTEEKEEMACNSYYRDHLSQNVRPPFPSLRCPPQNVPQAEDPSPSVWRSYRGYMRNCSSYILRLSKMRKQMWRFNRSMPLQLEAP